MNTEEKLLKARTSLVLDHPFFGCLALRLKLIESNEIETATTDGTNLFYNAEYINELTNEETTGFLAHEVMHTALGHTWRQGSRESKKWNMAADYTINYNLIGAGFTLPEGGLFNPDLKDKSAEEIYEILPDQQQQDGGSGNGEDKQDIDPGRSGGVLPIEGEQATEKAKAEMKAAVNQALQIAKGTLPENLERQIKEILETVVPWYVLLRDLVERSARNDYDWTRPSRRYLSGGLVLPSLISEQLPEVVVAIDTSASITEEHLSTFSAEASAVLGAYDTTIRIIYCDARVQEEETFTRTDLPLKLKMIGGGGTNFAPVFEHITKKGHTPSCLIYFTDLCGSFPTQEPEYPVMWLVPKPRDNRERTAPFGDVVKF